MHIGQNFKCLHRDKSKSLEHWFVRMGHSIDTFVF